VVPGGVDDREGVSLAGAVRVCRSGSAAVRQPVAPAGR